MAVVLITGGTGLIGTALSSHLLSKGYEVRHLSRKADKGGKIPAFQWNIERRSIDDAALIGVDHIVHLAGAGIADKRWSKARIAELIRSRVDSAQLLLDRVIALDLRLKSFVSAAGIGYYGAITTAHKFKETDPPGGDSIARISEEWENAVDAWQERCRVVKLRTPVVLSGKGGALPKLAKPVRFGLGTALGTGEQWMPWVHIHDLVRIYTKAIEDKAMRGAFNANTGNDVNNHTIMRSIAEALNKPFFLPAVPAFVLRLALGEMSSVLLEGSRADNSKLLATGFRFSYPEISEALADLKDELRP